MRQFASQSALDSDADGDDEDDDDDGVGIIDYSRKRRLCVCERERVCVCTCLPDRVRLAFIFGLLSLSSLRTLCCSCFVFSVSYWV